MLSLDGVVLATVLSPDVVLPTVLWSVVVLSELDVATVVKSSSILLLELLLVLWTVFSVVLSVMPEVVDSELLGVVVSLLVVWVSSDVTLTDVVTAPLGVVLVSTGAEEDVEVEVEEVGEEEEVVSPATVVTSVPELVLV